MSTTNPDPEIPVDKLNVHVPHSARVWSFWLGGKDNFQADRDAGQQVIDHYPEIVEIARASRAFLARAVTYLAGEVGIRQYLDIGTGLPTTNNTHEVAQRIAPGSRIVYVDNDRSKPGCVHMNVHRPVAMHCGDRLTEANDPLRTR